MEMPQRHIYQYIYVCICVYVCLYKRGRHVSAEKQSRKKAEKFCSWGSGMKNCLYCIFLGADAREAAKRETCYRSAFNGINAGKETKQTPIHTHTRTQTRTHTLKAA